MGIWGSLPLHTFQSFICSGCSHLLNTLIRQYGFSPLEPLNLNFISSPWGSSSLPLLPPFPNPVRAIFQSQEKYPCSLSALFPQELSCDFSRCTYVYPLWWDLKTKAKGMRFLTSQFSPLTLSPRDSNSGPGGQWGKFHSQRDGQRKRISLLNLKMLSHCPVSREINVCPLKNYYISWDVIISSKFNRL